MPSTTRPPDSADSEVTARASIGAGRLGRLVTLAKPLIRPVRPSRKPSAAYASTRPPTYGWSDSEKWSNPSRSACWTTSSRLAVSARSPGAPNPKTTPAFPMLIVPPEAKKS